MFIIHPFTIRFIYLPIPDSSTVCFFSFVIFYNDETQKVVEIIDFRKKFQGGMVDAFYDM